MSYILDALKKSDRSRQLNTTHDILISSETTASHKRWKWPVLISLLLAILVAGIFASKQAWFERSQSPAASVVASGSGETKAESMQELDAEVAAVSGETVSLNSVAKRLERNKKVDPVNIKQAERKSLQSLLGEREAEKKVEVPELRPVTQVREAVSPTGLEDALEPADDAEPGLVSLTTYPNYRSVRSSLSGLEEMHLDILAYHADVNQRRAYINMQKYYEGDTTEAGSTIQAIRSDGVVMSYRGQEFILTAK